MKKYLNRYWQKEIKILRKKCKTLNPVRIFFRPFSFEEKDQMLGYTKFTYGNKTDEIHIDSDLPTDTQWLVLLHEWGHAMVGPGHKHKNKWAIAHGQVFRAIYPGH